MSVILRQKIKSCSVPSLQKKSKSDPHFLETFLTPAEMRYCLAKRHFAEPAAARWAAKEACLALFEIPKTEKLKWFLQLEIKKTTHGQPVFKFSSAFRKKIKLLKNQSVLLSLAHERERAIAWVVLPDAVGQGRVRKRTHSRWTASDA